MMEFWKKTAGWKLPLLGVIGLSFALISVLGRTQTPPKDPVVMPPVTPYLHTVAGIGVIEPKSESISIGVELPGLARNIYVKVGDQVKKGAPLFSLDQRDIDGQIQTLKAMLASAHIQAEEAAAQFQLVNNVNDNRAVSKDEYNRRQYAAKGTAARVNEITAQMNQAQITKERLTIRAPIDCSILEVNIRPGEFAAAGATSEPIIRVGDVTTRHIRAEFDEEKAAQLSPKNQASAMKRGDPSKTYPLRFVRFEPYIAPKKNLAVAGQRVDTRVLQVIYALPAEAKDFFIGQQMDVFVQSTGGEDKK